MSFICALGIPTAILCGLWSHFSGVFGLIGWAGFAGCTTYFACGSKGFEGIRNTVCTNMSGVFWGMTIIVLSNLLPIPFAGGIYTAIVTFFMCIQNRFKVLAFIPGTFLGCFSTFASGGDWKLLIPSMLLGALLGIACDKSGAWFFEKFGKKEADTDSNKDLEKELA